MLTLQLLYLSFYYHNVKLKIKKREIYLFTPADMFDFKSRCGVSVITFLYLLPTERKQNLAESSVPYLVQR